MGQDHRDGTQDEQTQEASLCSIRFTKLGRKPQVCRASLP